MLSFLFLLTLFLLINSYIYLLTDNILLFFYILTSDLFLLMSDSYTMFILIVTYIVICFY